ncbi:hypothetical protein NPIL_552531 [Nephila pilipes]|uniref:Uncharacterized protein n=1 Tax=Nephila pilipes TaxID=299642 RepID=A0A8X6QN37_NEPPI|nr:hypothetical protein NPIL_552531 [Nephila pilipes]
MVIFVDSSAAILAISNHHHSETQIITQIKKDINILIDKKYSNCISIDNLNVICKDTKWQDTQNTWKTYNLRPRKEAIAHFRLMTGHDCLEEHLNMIDVLDTNMCPICKSGIMDSVHLLDCAGLDRVAKEQDHLGLYWDLVD